MLINNLQTYQKYQPIIIQNNPHSSIKPQVPKKIVKSTVPLPLQQCLRHYPTQNFQQLQKNWNDDTKIQNKPIRKNELEQKSEIDRKKTRNNQKNKDHKQDKRRVVNFHVFNQVEQQVQQHIKNRHKKTRNCKSSQINFLKKTIEQENRKKEQRDKKFVKEYQALLKQKKQFQKQQRRKEKMLQKVKPPDEMKKKYEEIFPEQQKLSLVIRFDYHNAHQMLRKKSDKQKIHVIEEIEESKLQKKKYKGCQTCSIQYRPITGKINHIDNPPIYHITEQMKQQFRKQRLFRQQAKSQIKKTLQLANACSLVPLMSKTAHRLITTHVTSITELIVDDILLEMIILLQQNQLRIHQAKQKKKQKNIFKDWILNIEQMFSDNEQIRRRLQSKYELQKRFTVNPLVRIKDIYQQFIYGPMYDSVSKNLFQQIDKFRKDEILKYVNRFSSYVKPREEYKRVYIEMFFQISEQLIDQYITKCARQIDNGSQQFVKLIFEHQFK